LKAFCMGCPIGLAQTCGRNMFATTAAREAQLAEQIVGAGGFVESCWRAGRVQVGRRSRQVLTAQPAQGQLDGDHSAETEA
jgi:hypothetical protein